MSISPRAAKFDDECMWVELEDGRTIGAPLAWFLRLLHAFPEDRAASKLSRRGLHWDNLDEDISIGELLQGRGDQNRARIQAA